MIIFLAASASLSVAALWQGRAETPKLETIPIMTGKWTPAYEHIFNKKLYSYDTSKDGWGALNYAAFQEGNKGVLIGSDGWLFTSEEFEKQPAQNQHVVKNLSYIRAVHDYLSMRNIELLIVPIPAKARLYRDQLGRYKFPAYKENIYETFMNNMAEYRIMAVDTMYAMSLDKPSQDMFLKTDTHWTPEGARAAAQAAAYSIRQNLNLPLNQASYHSVVKKQAIHQGDLLRYIPAGLFAERLQLPEDKLNVFETVETGIEPAAGDVSEALFSDNAPSITLVGTSYSANPKWNFAGFLKETLKADVLNAADEGLGPFETMQEYLQNEAFRSAPPKIVIWEIPERYLSFPYDLKTDFAMDGA